VLVAVVAAMVSIVGAGVAYADNSALELTSTGDRGAQPAGNEDSGGPGDTEDDD
jgi:hypothetical protein